MSYIYDVIGLLGLAMIIYAMYMVSTTAAIAFIGAVFCAIAVLGARR